jgi:ABC-2 type transport system permease protein
VLKGTRQVLLGHPSASDIIANLIPLIVIGVVTIPLGIWLFTTAQRFAKRTGRLKRTG